tara:strand:+ start:98 stop:1063 length:966 start_codon:yes stop_codon:yes gene_type:complete
MPADPAKIKLGEHATLEDLEREREKMNLNAPLYDRYLGYLNDLSPISIHLNSDLKEYNVIKLFSTGRKSLVFKKPYLGRSYHDERLVSEKIWEAFPNTMVLAISSIILAIFIGIPIGTICAIKKDHFVDRFFSTTSILGMSLPSFFSAIIIMWIFAYKLNWLTNLNVTGSLYEVDDLGRGEYISLKNLILPAITLGIRPIAVIVNLTRNSLLESLSSNYVIMAKAKGLSPFNVVVKHALRNSLIPVLTTTSGWFASMLSGAVFVEYIFGWNGIGKLLVDSLENIDIPLAMGLIILIGVCFVFINILVDLMYSLLDPRIKIN